jgi:hypothetical protein
MVRLAAVLAASLLLAACALDVDVDSAEAGALPAVDARPVELPEGRLVQGNDLVRLQRASRDAVGPVSDARALVAQPPQSSGLDVDVELEPRLDAVALRGLFAIPSCGWWPIASAEAVPSNGQVTFSFVPKDDVGAPGSLTDGQLFFFADHDGDGACDASTGDEVFTAPLSSGSTTFSVALAQLEPSPYSCSLFSYLP